MKPISAGLCTMGEAKSGLLDMADFALMNDTLLVQAENAWRQAEEDKQNGG